MIGMVYLVLGPSYNLDIRRSYKLIYFLRNDYDPITSGVIMGASAPKTGAWPLPKNKSENITNMKNNESTTKLC